MTISPERGYRTRLTGSPLVDVCFFLRFSVRLTLIHPGRILSGNMATVAAKPLIQQFRQHDTDTGSPQVQIALLTERITQLSTHFQSHKKDFNSRQGLLRMVSRRRKLLEYLKRHDEIAYRAILDALNLRK